MGNMLIVSMETIRFLLKSRGGTVNEVLMAPVATLGAKVA
jgi:hypothetical protein